MKSAQKWENIPVRLEGVPECGFGARSLRCQVATTLHDIDGECDKQHRLNVVKLRKLATLSP